MTDHPSAPHPEKIFRNPAGLEKVFRMCAEEASHPESAAHVSRLVEFAGTSPGREALVTLVGSRIEELPCLQHALVQTLNAEDVPEFSFQKVGWNPKEQILERPVAPGGLEAVVREQTLEPLSPERPWRFVLLSGYHPERFSLLWQGRHEVQDGATVSAVLETLFGTNPRAKTVPEKSPTPSADFPDPAATALKLAQPAAPPYGPGGIWENFKPSGERWRGWVQCPAEDLRRIGRAFGTSANDVYLAAFAHATLDLLRQHCPESQIANSVLPILIPVNIRPEAERADPGNRFFAARLDVPGSVQTAAECLEAIKTLTAPFRDAAVRSALWEQAQTNMDFLAANLPGGEWLSTAQTSFRFRQNLAWQGRDVLWISQIPPCVEGFPAITMLSTYEGSVPPGHQPLSILFMQCDRALPGYESLMGRWQQAVRDLAHAAQKKNGGQTVSEPHFSSFF